MVEDIGVLLFFASLIFFPYYAYKKREKEEEELKKMQALEEKEVEEIDIKDYFQGLFNKQKKKLEKGKAGEILRLFKEDEKMQEALNEFKDYFKEEKALMDTKYQAGLKRYYERQRRNTLKNILSSYYLVCQEHYKPLAEELDYIYKPPTKEEKELKREFVKKRIKDSKPHEPGWEEKYKLWAFGDEIYVSNIGFKSYLKFRIEQKKINKYYLI